MLRKYDYKKLYPLSYNSTSFQHRSTIHITVSIYQHSLTINQTPQINQLNPHQSKSWVSSRSSMSSLHQAPMSQTAPALLPKLSKRLSAPSPLSQATTKLFGVSRLKTPACSTSPLVSLSLTLFSSFFKKDINVSVRLGISRCSQNFHELLCLRPLQRNPPEHRRCQARCYAYQLQAPTGHHRPPHRCSSHPTHLRFLPRLHRLW